MADEQHADDRAVPARRRTGRQGSVLATAMIGLERALYDREPNELVELVDAGGHGEDPITLYLHPDIPEASLVLVRLPRPLDDA